MTSGSRATPIRKSWYEDAIGELLEQVGGVDEGSITEAVRLYNDRPAEVDKVTPGSDRAGSRGARTQARS